MDCNGGSLPDIIDDVDRFIRDNPELVILWVSHDRNIDTHYESIDQSTWGHVLDLLERLDHQCPNLDGDITQKTMNELIGSGDACVRVVVESHDGRPSKGLYDTSQFPHYDSYADTNDLTHMTDDQISKMHKNRQISRAAPSEN